jgi:hypothetical protein
VFFIGKLKQMINCFWRLVNKKPLKNPALGRIFVRRPPRAGQVSPSCPAGQTTPTPFIASKINPDESVLSGRIAN